MAQIFEHLPDWVSYGLGSGLGALAAATSIKHGGLGNFLAQRSQALTDPDVRSTLGPFTSGFYWVPGQHVPVWNTGEAGNPSHEAGQVFMPQLPPESEGAQLKRANLISELQNRELNARINAIKGGLLARIMGGQQGLGIPEGAAPPAVASPINAVGQQSNGLPQMLINGPVAMPQTAPPQGPPTVPASAPISNPSQSLFGNTWPEGVQSVNVGGFNIGPPAFEKVKAGTLGTDQKVLKTGDPLGNKKALVEPAADTGQVDAQIKRAEGALQGYKYLYVDKVKDKSGKEIGYARDVLPDNDAMGFLQSRIPGVQSANLNIKRFEGDPRAQVFTTGQAQAVDFARAVGGAARMNETEIKKLQEAFVPSGRESKDEYDNKVAQTLGFINTLIAGLRARKNDIAAFDKMNPPTSDNPAGDNPIAQQVRAEAYAASGLTPPEVGPANPPDSVLNTNQSLQQSNEIAVPGGVGSVPASIPTTDITPQKAQEHLNYFNKIGGGK